MPALTSLIAAGSAIAGLVGKGESQSSNSSINPGSATQTETTGQNGMMEGYGGFRDMVNAGPGQQDVTNATGASRDFASMLQSYSQGQGSQPTASDMSTGQGLASSLFNPQRTQLGQNFVDQTTQANRQAAMMGRDVNDPILQAKLRTEQSRQSAMLDANQGAFATQYAMQQPMQRLQFANQHAAVLGGLATQAMQNRSALAGMGEGIMQNERNFRLAAASKSNTASQSSGGGLGGAITGGLAGLGAGMKMASGMGWGANPAPSFSGAGGGGFSGPNSSDWATAMGAPGSAPAQGDWSYGFKG